ncbi:MAG: NAD(P)-dependent oxidoreductase [Planctomycetota bacterium]
MMRVLIADSFEDFAVSSLRELGCEVTFQPGLTGNALKDAVLQTRCQVLIVRSTVVNEAMLNAGEHLGLVVRAGAGYNTIDVAAASHRSILVSNCPGKNAVAVAELTFGLILALDRRIVENTVDLRNGKWNKKDYGKARGLKGRTLGILGLGRIGEEVARRARAFDMPVLAWSRSLDPQRAAALGVTQCDTPQQVAEKCDVLSVHLAAGPQTKGLINADVLNRLQPGSFVINTARADVLDHKALAAAVKERRLRVGLDVYPGEPTGGEAEFHAEILHAGGVIYGTHHIGASTDQAQTAIALETVRIVTVYMRTGQVENCVNLCARSPAKYVLLVRHRNRPGVLAHTLNEVSQAGVNVQEMQNVICDGAEAACAQIKLDAPLTDSVLHRIKSGNEHVLGLSLSSIRSA